MIQIRNERGEIAELYPGTSITIEKNNPLFNENDKLFEDISYAFKMPATENNKVFFNWGHLVETENQAYKMPIHLIVSGISFYAGSIRFSFIDGDFDVLLLVNFGDLAEEIKNIKVHDIYTGDALPTFFTAAYMKLTCQYPEQYPYAFFPVYNESWNVGQPSRDEGTVMVNTWDHVAQAFTMPAYLGRALAPYVKLKYFLEKVFNYLGFAVSGSFFDDPETSFIYIYTRYGSKGYFLGTNTVMNRNLTITQFLKIVKERFKVAFSFDVLKGVVNAESANAILSSPDAIDLRAYTTAVTEISLPDIEGYNVVLKPDDQDELFLQTVLAGDDKKKAIPTNRLIIGNGAEKETEIKGSTLKSKVVDDYSMPATKQSIFQVYRDEDLPIRFLRFTGMKAVAGGKVFPEATPLELNESDGNWWRFLNDSKKVSIQLTIPIDVLASITSTSKIVFLSNEGNACIALLEKLPFTLTSEDQTMISVKIDARTIVASFNTPIVLEPIYTALVGEVNALSFKSFFNSNQTGLEKVDIQFYNPAIPSLSPVFSIIESTDYKGYGGQTPFLGWLSQGNRLTVRNFELRVLSGTPKYLIIKGQKLYFTARDGYWYCNYNQPFADWLVTDGIPGWIVF